ncbi:ALDH-like protein [Rickenella mellea]|uniref:ALDH-like protein n=1 Tax=Rickenella mellea TaxID=50990 RepID=A0A4Y7QC87_9AGAM|nr:ALDH-like protein [Rickenella mellea]
MKAADLIQTDKYVQNGVRAIEEETAAVKLVAMMDIQMAARTLIDAAGQATQIQGDFYESTAVPGAQVLVSRKPHGVIFAIPPWNGPVILTLRAICIPLICGNTVVVKPAEVCPRSQAVAIEVLHEAGIPPGVLNLVSVSKDNSPKLTAEIIANPLVRHINFTGSDRVGKILAAEAAKYLKPCVFELGGKAPAVVLDDANISDAARAITFGALLHSGQVCMSTERVIVQRGAAATLQSELLKLFRNVKAGDPTRDPSAQLSCLINEASAVNVVKMVEEAKSSGAQVLLGDIRREGARVQPHILTGVNPGMRAWDRESFGPVVVISVVDTVDEAIELANASEYSLTASVWASDRYKGVEVANQIRAGCTSVNGPTIHIEPGLELAGLGGATGYGRFTVDNFTVKRGVVVHPPNVTYPLTG